MPPTLDYPGVYIQEIPSGVRPITGVATSIAAFLGKTAKGVEKTPFTITSFADYEREFGPLDMKYPLGFSVRGFYENGGATAIIVRAFKAENESAVATIEHKKDDNNLLRLEAKSPGSWAAGLRIRIERGDAATQDALKEYAQSLGLPDATTLFNLRIFDTKTKTELPPINNLTAEATARQITGVLGANAAIPLKVAKDGLKGKIDAHPIPTTPEEKKKDIWADDSTFSTGVTTPAKVKDSANLDEAALGEALAALDHADLFNLLVVPPPNGIDGDVPKGFHATAAKYCKDRRALYIVDPPTEWTSVDAAKDLTDINITGPDARYAAVYFPRVRLSNPLHGGQVETFTASGIIAGVMARTDTTRGVWKAPAGTDAALVGVQGLALEPPMSDKQNGILNPLGVNALRYFPIIGHVVWGARTLRGADLLGDEYKYVPVRRTANFIEESLFRGLKWVVFEPNDEPLWAQIRLNVGAFMQGLFRQGAFQGTSARDAYFVACDKTTTTQNDINLGIVNVVVGFAPLKPAEFVVVTIQQIAGQIQV